MPYQSGMAQERRKRWSRLIKGAVSLGFFVLLFKLIEGREIIECLRNVDWRFLVLSVLIAPAMVGVNALKWKLLVEAQGARLGYWRLFRTYLIGYYFSNLLPSNIGGDVVRSYYAGKAMGSQSRAAVSVLVERIFGFIILFLLAIGLPFLEPKMLRMLTIVIPMFIAAAGLAAFIVVLAYTRPLTMFFSALRSCCRALARAGVLQLRAERMAEFCIRLREKAEGFHDRLDASFADLRNRPPIGLALAALTCLHYFLAWANVWITFLGFGVRVPVAASMAVLPVAMVVGMLPIALGGLGISESSYVYFFGLLGVAKGATLTMALFLRLKLVLVGIAGLIIYLSAKEEAPPDGGFERQQPES